MQHTIIALVEDKPGVLNRVVSLFRKRNFNIDSLTVSVTEKPGISRMTIVIDSDRVNASRVMVYLHKLINVIEVEDLAYAPMVSRDLALVKVNTKDVNRTEVMQLVEAFRGRIVDVAPDSLIVEITGTRDKVDGFVEVLRPIGIIEMARAGAVAMERGRTTLSRENGHKESSNVLELPIVVMA
ncbi:MAG: acetolactate synthase small subunit [Anaerolineaceae bacterium]|nr:acetolactate synthase small subunit [Anaerolineaceae bacterium]